MTPAELRDFFAGLAMQSLIADTDNATWEGMFDTLGEDRTVAQTRKVWAAMHQRYTAHRAYQQADAMMREREKL